jgi:hypothetical protein
MVKLNRVLSSKLLLFSIKYRFPLFKCVPVPSTYPSNLVRSGAADVSVNFEFGVARCSRKPMVVARPRVVKNTRIIFLSLSPNPGENWPVSF